MQKINNSTRVTVYFLTALMGFGLITNCSNNQTDQSEPENLERDQEQQQELLEERNDSTLDHPPIFEASLDETPDAEGDTEGEGTLTLTLEGDSIHIKGQFSGLSSEYTDSYIHQALESDRIQKLNPAVSEDKRSGTWESSYRLDEGDISMLKKDSLYISVYSTDFESGELRGQLSPKEEDSTDVN